MNFGEMADSVEMPFGMVFRVGPRNHVLIPDSPMGTGKDKFGGNSGVQYRRMPNWSNAACSQIPLKNLVKI